MRRVDEQASDMKEWRRQRAWELYEQGWLQKKIAEALGVSRGAVSQWIKKGREQGKEALRGSIAPGGKARLNDEQLTELSVLLDQGAEAHGFRGNVWTTKRVAELIKRYFSVIYHHCHCSRILKKMRYSVQLPEERATQRDEQAIATWKQERWPTLKKSR